MTVSPPEPPSLASRVLGHHRRGIDRWIDRGHAQAQLLNGRGGDGHGQAPASRCSACAATDSAQPPRWIAAAAPGGGWAGAATEHKGQPQPPGMAGATPTPDAIRATRTCRVRARCRTLAGCVLAVTRRGWIGHRRTTGPPASDRSKASHHLVVGCFFSIDRRCSGHRALLDLSHTLIQVLVGSALF
uniref:Uncharacterized protein n=1 Tax=Setaria viridis TaxID=4556 RepID=A0A4U6UPL1_SETVI|nr:hypothetical protein SEVIR_5G422250v2 [Setaria viridis]